MRKRYLAAMLVLGCLGVGAAHAEPLVVFDYRSTHRSDVGDGTVHEVIWGETLNGILRRYFGAATDLQALSRQAVALNPEAFIRSDPNLLRAGARLRLPAALATETVAGGDDIYFF